MKSLLLVFRTIKAKVKIRVITKFGVKVQNIDVRELLLLVKTLKGLLTNMLSARLDRFWQML